MDLMGIYQVFRTLGIWEDLSTQKWIKMGDIPIGSR
jgi:hypothetical protein